MDGVDRMETEIGAQDIVDDLSDKERSAYDILCEWRWPRYPDEVIRCAQIAQEVAKL